MSRNSRDPLIPLILLGLAFWVVGTFFLVTGISATYTRRGSSTETYDRYSRPAEYWVGVAYAFGFGAFLIYLGVTNPRR